MGTSGLLRLLSWFSGVSVLQQVGSWSISVPKSVTAVEGSCVVVPCQTQPHSQVIWYQYHKINYPVVYNGADPHRVESQFRGRTSVLGEAAEGNCSLMIDNVRRADNRLQVYVWINPDSKSTQRFYDQTVTIFVERKAPIISVQRQIVEGQIFQVNCSINYSCPSLPPSIHWSKSSFLENSTFTKEVQGQWLYRETMHGLATYEMHTSKIICYAQFRTFNGQGQESQEITLNILHKPVAVSLKLESKTVTEDGSIIMECDAKSNPQPHAYSWLRRQKGQTNKINSTQGRMSFHNITRDTSLSCMALNGIGVGQSDWVDVDVHYAPVIRPESSCSRTKDVLRCVCRAEASPNASIYWTIDGNDTLPSSLTSSSTNKKHVVSGYMQVPAKGLTNVSCTAWNRHGRDTKLLSIGSLPKTSSLLIWLSCLIVLGIASLIGCVIFHYRKWPRNRSQDFSGNIHEEERYTCQRPKVDDTQSGQQRSERNSEVDRLSCVYDNDCVEEIRRSHTAEQHGNNAAAAQREEGEIHPLVKGEHCDMGVYLNC